MARWLHLAIDALAALAATLVRLGVGAMLAVLAWQVFMRSALNRPPSWTDEVALLLFSWTVLLAVACGVRDGLHVRMDILLDLLPAVLREACERLVQVGVTGAGAYLAVAGWHYTLASRGTTSAAIAYPMPLLYASTVACGALVAVFGAERLLAVRRQPAEAAPAPQEQT